MSLETRAANAFNNLSKVISSQFGVSEASAYQLIVLSFGSIMLMLVVSNILLLFSFFFSTRKPVEQPEIPENIRENIPEKQTSAFPSRKKKKKKKKKTKKKVIAEPVVDAKPKVESVIDRDDDAEEDDDDDFQVVTSKKRGGKKPKSILKKVKQPEIEEKVKSTSKKVHKSSSNVEAKKEITKVEDDGWVVAGGNNLKSKKKKTHAKNQLNAVEKDAPKAKTWQVKIDPKKIGHVIGPKGATLHAIQDGTGVHIQMPNRDREDTNTAQATIVLTGEDVYALKQAKTAIQNMCEKGYCKFTTPDDFKEDGMNIHPQYFNEIIGKSGSVIKALQTNLKVRVNIPKTERAWNHQANSEKQKAMRLNVGISGSKANVDKAKEIIKQICAYYHAPETHPGVIHQSIDVEPRYYNILIGTKGANIKYVQSNFRVRMFIPNDYCVTKSVLIVGEATAVARAAKYCLKQVDDYKNEKSAATKKVDEIMGNGDWEMEEGEIDIQGDSWTPAKKDQSGPAKEASVTDVEPENDAWISKYKATLD